MRIRRTTVPLLPWPISARPFGPSRVVVTVGRLRGTSQSSFFAYEHDRAHPGDEHARPGRGPAADPPVRRDPLPQRGGEHRGLRHQGPRRHGAQRHRRRGRRRRQRLRGPQRRARHRRRRTGRARAPPRLRLRLPRGLRRGPRRVHRHGRRGSHLRLRRHPALPRAAPGRRPARHGRPDGQHPARRDAVAAPLRRQPDPVGHPQRLLPHRHPRCPLRHARPAARHPAHARPADDGHGVRLGDGHPGLEGEARHPRVPDRVPPARRRVQALVIPRRLAPPALPARPLADAPLRHPGRAAGVRRADHRAGRRRADPGLRPRLAAALDGRRRAAHDRRHAGPCARVVRARLRHVLHGREGPVVRPHARPVPPRARPDARRRDHRRRHRHGRRDRRHLDQPRLRRALRRAARAARRDVHHRRHPDLLLVVPAQHPRPAPERPLSVVRRVRSWPSALAGRPILVVGAIVVVSAAVAAWFTSQMVQFEPDEIGYTKIAIQIGDLMQPFSTTTLGRDRINQLYPLIISPLYQAFGNLRATQAAHLLNPLIVSSAAIPAYLLARRVLQGSRGWSYLIAALVAMTPWLTMSAVQLTEVAAFPASVWAMWAMQRGLDEPSPWRDVIAFAVIGVATFGRLQLIILAPVYVAVVVLHEVLFDRRLAWRRLRALHWPVLGIALFGVLVVLPLLVSGVLAKLFGFYGNTLSADHFPPGIWDLARTNFVFMAFGIGLLPAAAAIGLFVDQVIRPRDRGLHAFALLSALTGAALIVQVSSVNVTFNFSVVQERYTMFVAPVLLIAGFALWLRGTRPGLMTLVGAVPLVVLVATTSYSTARDSFWYLVSPGLTTFYDVVGPRLSDVPGTGGASQTALLAIVLGGLAVLVWLALRDDRPARRARLAGALGALLLVFTVGVTVHALDRVIHGGPGGPGLGAGSLAGVDWIDRSLPAGQSATLLAPQVGPAADPPPRRGA